MALLVLALPGVARAQATVVISGTVTDEGGGVLPGVRVLVRSADGELVATGETDAAGAYRVSVASRREPVALWFSLVSFATARAVVEADDLHTHPALPRMLRVSLQLTF